MTAPYKPFNHHFSRRSFLGGLGVSASIVPFVPLLEAQATVDAPKRLLIMFSPCGTIPDAWRPSGDINNFTFGPILSPLDPVKDQITVIEGLRFPNGGAGNRHMSGPSKFSCGTGLKDGGEFSGGGNASAGWGDGTSIDQVYAEQSGQHTPFASLEIGVRATGGGNPRNRLAYAAPGQPIAPENNPNQVFDRLFADFDPSGGQDQTALEQLRAERRSVLDIVKGQTDAIEQRIGSSDRTKLEAHLHGLREIEKRLDLTSDAGSACMLPEINDVNHTSTDKYPEVTRLHMDILAMAFACDLTRSATFMWNGSTSSQTFPWLNIGGASHHDLSHEGDGNQDAKNKLIKINTWYSEQMAYLVDRMAQIPEGDGSMLDNTLIVWGNELGKGNNHSHNNIPIVLAGGRNLGIEPGRYLKFDDVAHNRLLVSILNAVDISVDTYGKLDNGSGPLPGL